jgi:hypothetical protein
LIILAVAKKHFKEVRKINKELYHSPLLITVAKEVNTPHADLKVFYKLLSDIALKKYGNFEDIKENLIETISKNKEYVIKNLGTIDDSIITDIRNLTEDEFHENVFNTKNRGKIEVIKFKNNTRELAFSVKGSNRYFGLIYASDILKWEDNILENYEFKHSVESEIFKDINHREEINLLLGSRIFIEGWDSNRPNIINFINIGVNEEAKKLVLQTIGRGIRIEPIKGVRKRLDYINKSKFNSDDLEKIRKYNKILETLFIFATNKEVIKNILEDLEKQSEKWIKLKGVKKNPKIDNKKLPLYILKYEEDILNDDVYTIPKKDFENICTYAKTVGDKVLLLKNNINVRTLNKLKNKENFKISGKEKKYNPEIFIKNIDAFFNRKTKKLTGFKILENEINHYRLKEKLKEIKKSEKITDEEFIDIAMEFAKKLKNEGISPNDLKTLGLT